MVQLALGTISMSLITDHHLRRNSRYTTIQTMNMNYLLHLLAQITHPRSPLCLEDRPLYANPRFSSDMVKRLLGVEGMQLRCSQHNN